MKSFDKDSFEEQMERQKPKKREDESQKWENWLSLRAEQGEKAGRIYYLNVKTNESVWEKPDCVATREAELKAAEAPIAVRNVGTSGWFLVATNHRNYFWYHAERRYSTWDIPDEIAGLVKKIQIYERTHGPKRPTKRITDDSELPDNNEATKRTKLTEHEEEVDEKSQEAEEFGEDDFEAQLAMMQEEEEEATEQLEVQEPELTELDRIAAFKELLEESKLTPFSLWETEVKKLRKDERFHLIESNKQREQIFFQFCQEKTAQQEKKEAGPKRTPKELFIELLDEVHAPKLRLDEFSRKYRRDRRFMGLDARERERLFKEHSKGFADRKKKQDEKLKQDFIQLLRETKNITKKSRWSQIREEIRTDSRYQKITSSTRREDLFYDYVENSLLDQKDREREAIRQREQEARKEKERREHSIASGRAAVQHEEANRLFDQLLTDHVRQHHATWEKARTKIETDSRFSTCKQLMRDSEMKTRFDAHVKKLLNICVEQFFALLDSTLPALTTTRISFASDIFSLISDDPRFTRLLLRPPERTLDDVNSLDPNDLKYVDNLFKEYLRKRLDELRSDFKELLQEKETLLSYRFVASEVNKKKAASDEDVEMDDEDIQDDSIRGHVPRDEAVGIVQEDKRYDRMHVLLEERERMIDEWLERVGREYSSKKFNFDSK